MAEIATGVVESTVSDWAAPIVGGLVGAAVDTAAQDYQLYGGNKVADASDLQSNAFTGISGLAAPTAVTNATNALGNVYTKASTQPAYAGTTFGNQFTAPGAYSPTTQGSTYGGVGAYSPATATNQFGGVSDFQAGQFTSGFNAPQAYTGGTFNAGTVSAGLGAPGSVESYMNPYLQNVVDVQAREARRQADIQRAADARKFQGAFGGGRQALYNSENVRNVNQQIGDIQAKGSQAAYDTALKQRLAEAEQYRLGSESTAKLGLEAQKAGEESRQFGAKQGLASSELAAKYGLDAQRMGEESRQFAAKQGLTEAELQAKYGQAAFDAGEASRQFAAKQGISDAELRAKYGLEAARLSEDSRQFGAKQGLTSADLAAKYGLEGLKASEESRQFGAGLGLKYLSEAGNAATNMGNIGVNQANFDLNRLKSMADMGATKRAIDQEGLTSDYRDFLEQRDWDKTQQKYLKDMLSGIPMTTQNQYTEAPSTANNILSGVTTAAGVYDKLYNKTPGK
jgi:bisphosphoglycerate-dependent phosphoglycerate mutase